VLRALANNPKIILADEPTGALDQKNALATMEMLSQIAQGRLVIVVSHDSLLAEKFATRKITLKDGDVISDDSQKQIVGR